ncbi:MAG TPA: glycosyltransferase family 4 protein [bacterium]|nr:glycosyltransferase family 4 protein [bacterium]
MRIGMLSPIAWRTPPRHYGPWERVVSLLTEGLIAAGVEVTLFATGDSRTRGTLHAVCPSGYEEDQTVDPQVWSVLHISEVFERADEFDIIHNHFDFTPLTYSRLVRTPLLTTIHGFSSPRILPVYKKYDATSFYVSISDADRAPELSYAATIHHGIDLENFTFNPNPEDYLLYFGRIHPDKGTREAIDIAKLSQRRLIIAGIIQDNTYFRELVQPELDGKKIEYVGSVGPDQRNQLLGKAFALLHPINFAEPFGLSVVESFACGTPVVAYNKGSMPEIILPGRTGFLVSTVEEAVKAVRTVPEIDRTDCRSDAEQRFGVERMVDEYIQVYEQILQ